MDYSDYINFLLKINSFLLPTLMLCTSVTDVTVFFIMQGLILSIYFKKQFLFSSTGRFPEWLVLFITCSLYFTRITEPYWKSWSFNSWKERTDMRNNYKMLVLLLKLGEFTTKLLDPPFWKRKKLSLFLHVRAPLMIFFFWKWWKKGVCPFTLICAGNSRFSGKWGDVG